MERRAFLATVGGGLLAAPLAAEAQHARKVPLVGILTTGFGARTGTVDIAREGLRDLGYVEGRTIAFEVRLAGGKPEVFPTLAADLVRRQVDVILVSGPAGLRAASNATSTIPIVALDLESDPVQAGFIRSLAQPGGNITGCFLDQPGLTGKWMELVTEVAPDARRVAMLVDPTTGPWQLAAITAAAQTLKIELQVLPVRSLDHLNLVLEGSVTGASRALVQLSSPLFDIPGAKRIADFAMKRRLPEAGGLMSYGPQQYEYSRRLSVYIDKILRGAKAADLPVEQAAKFDFIINLRTAKALGLTIPPSLLQRADQVIE